MRLFPQSLAARLVGSAAVFIVLAVLATGVAVSFALHRFVQGQIDQRLDGQLMTLDAALLLQPDGTVALSRNVDGPPFDNPHTGWFWTARSPGATWQSRGLRADSVDLEPVPSDADVGPPRLLMGMGPGHRPLRARARRIALGDQTIELVAAAPLDALNGPLRDALLPLITALAVLGTGLILATFVQVRLGLRPLRALQDLLVAVRTGQLDRLPAQQPTEVRPLVLEMNRLLEQNDANLERARRHVGNLAHGLKTPLATLSVALDAPGRDESRSLRALVAAMDRQIRHHLARARAAALGAPARSRLPLAARVADHAAAFGKIYADKAVTCRLDVPVATTVACDPQDLDELIGNLLDNAFKWARSTVAIRSQRDDTTVVLLIEDDGPGLSPEQYREVGRRGQRLDERVPGDGFGLAIVQELAELYGGGMALSPSALGGLQVRLSLPTAGRDDAA